MSEITLNGDQLYEIDLALRKSIALCVKYNRNPPSEVSRLHDKIMTIILRNKEGAAYLDYIRSNGHTPENRMGTDISQRIKYKPFYSWLLKSDSEFGKTDDGIDILKLFVDAPLTIKRTHSINPICEFLFSKGIAGDRMKKFYNLWSEYQVYKNNCTDKNKKEAKKHDTKRSYVADQDE